MTQESNDKIKTLKEKIKDHIKTIKKYDKQIERLKKDQRVFEDEKRCLENQIEQLIAEEWCKDAEAGKFKKHCYYSDIPVLIKREWQKIEDAITGGCTGDWYDGCRGCEKHCSWEASQVFMRKYNIGKIKYGSKSKKNHQSNGVLS